MTTYKIIASTNGYIAQRDVMFEKGKTTRELINGLSEKEANKKLVEFCQGDYKNSYVINTLEEWVKEYLASSTFYRSIESKENNNLDAYFKATKKRWLFLYEKANELFFRFEGPGVYENGNCIMNLTDTYYEYDSRYFSIQEEVLEEDKND